MTKSYNALGSMVFGLASIVGPVTAGPLIGSGHAGVWVALVITGSAVAVLLALNLRRHLTVVQDGRAGPAGIAPVQRLPEPVPVQS